MTNAFKMQSGVNLTKQTDVLTNPDLWEQNANLRKRLFEVARERDLFSGAVDNASGIVGELIVENRVLGDAAELLAKVTNGLNTDMAELMDERDQWRGEATRLRAESDRLKRQVREQLHSAFDEGEIEREAADELLEALGLDPLARKYRTTVTIEVTLEDLCREGGEPISAEDVPELLDFKVQRDGVSFDEPDYHVEVDDHDMIVRYF
ncbi:hypothetical protein ACWD5Q_32115 [Streptomyces sp. NPDC002513]